MSTDEILTSPKICFCKRCPHIMILIHKWTPGHIYSSRYVIKLPASSRTTLQFRLVFWAWIFLVGFPKTLLPKSCEKGFSGRGAHAIRARLRMFRKVDLFAEKSPPKRLWDVISEMWALLLEPFGSTSCTLWRPCVDCFPYRISVANLESLL